MKSSTILVASIATVSSFSVPEVSSRAYSGYRGAENQYYNPETPWATPSIPAIPATPAIPTYNTDSYYTWNGETGYEWSFDYSKKWEKDWKGFTEDTITESQAIGERFVAEYVGRYGSKDTPSAWRNLAGEIAESAQEHQWTDENVQALLENLEDATTDRLLFNYDQVYTGVAARAVDIAGQVATAGGAVGVTAYKEALSLVTGYLDENLEKFTSMADRGEDYYANIVKNGRSKCKRLKKAGDVLAFLVQELPVVASQAITIPTITNCE